MPHRHHLHSVETTQPMPIVQPPAPQPDGDRDLLTAAFALLRQAVMRRDTPTLLGDLTAITDTCERYLALPGLVQRLKDALQRLMAADVEKTAVIAALSAQLAGRSTAAPPVPRELEEALAGAGGEPVDVEVPFGGRVIRLRGVHPGADPAQVWGSVMQAGA